VSVKNPTNVAASIRQRLLNKSKENNIDFQRILDAYAIECILDRLARSVHLERFFLKGALLFLVWNGLGKRPTRDIDLLGVGDNDIDDIIKCFREIVVIDIKEDGVIFNPLSITGNIIKKNDDYEGVHLVIEGSFDSIKLTVPIDIGFGDIITPLAEKKEFPRLLHMQTFSMLMYPRETVVAEKFEAIVSLGLPNSRMKDYYDLYILIHDENIHVESVCRAVLRTFKRRKTDLPQLCPIGLSETFFNDKTKIAQWRGFLKSNKLEANELCVVVPAIKEFIQNACQFKW
jgi:hypothetical protein